jgi:thiol-disulfide isomerase/thioredoxin
MIQSATKLCFALSAVLGLTRAQASGYLNIGDPAPSLSHVKWLKGQPVQGFEKGKLYVVEFWATWCEPCKENIPRLTVLAQKYAGSVSIAGIDIWESTDKKDVTFGKRVETFVGKEGDKMAYNVGVDDLGSDTANAWMKASGEGAIPMSFVIGKDGKIAWMGHADGLDEVLAQVTADKFDVAAARARRATEVEAVRPVKEAMDAKQFRKALSLIDAIVAKRPNMDRFYDYDRYIVFAHIDPAKSKAMTEKLIKDSGGDIGAYQMMSSVYASEPDLSPTAYRYGMSIIQEALAKNDRQYLFLSMAGAVSHFLHERTEAIDYARRAVEAAQTDEHAPAPFREFLRRNLEALQTGKTS